MSGTHLMALPSPCTNFAQYKAFIESIPRLEADEERALAERLRSENDLQAAWRLVSSHLRYVLYIARGYRGYDLPQEDLVQEGNIGLMKAVQRFDPGRGVRLISYANYWIRAQIHEYILNNWRIVKAATTRARRKLFYKLRAAKQKLKWLNREEADMIAENLNVSAADVIAMEGRLYVPDEPFDPQDEADEDTTWAPAMYLEDSRYAPETVVDDMEFHAKARSALRDGLATLDERSRDIVLNRWLKEDDNRLTLQQLGERYGISAERVRQLEASAFKRLRKLMSDQLGPVTTA